MTSSITSLTLAKQDAQESSRKRRVNPEESFLLSGKDSFFDNKLEIGQKHNYQINLKQGEYLSLAITRKDVDIVAVLFDPNDKKLIETSTTNRPQDPEIGLYSLIETTGSYRLTISTKASQLVGNYAIKIKELRPSNKQDKERISSQAAYDEAERLRIQNSKESLQKAFNIYVALLPIWRQLGDREGEGATLNAISAIYFTTAQYKESLQSLEQALKIWRELNNPIWELAILTSLGSVSNLNKENRQALYYYLTAQQVANKLNNPIWLSFTFNGLGKVCSDLGEMEQSLNYYQQALVVKRTLLDKRGEAITLSNIANIYTVLQNYQSSLNYHLESLEVFNKIDDVSGEASTLNNIGRSYMLLNNYDKALENFSQALKKKQELKDPRGEATTLNNIGYLYMVSSEQKNSSHFTSSSYSSSNGKQKALDAFKQALGIWRKINDPLEEQTTLALIAKTYTALGEKEDADKTSQQIIALDNTIKANATSSIPTPTNTLVDNTSNNKTNEVVSNKTSINSIASNDNSKNPPSSITYLPKPNTPEIAQLPAKTRKTTTPSKKETLAKVEPANQPEAESMAKPPSSANAEKGKFSIQVGALSKKEEADALCNRLRSAGLEGYVAEGVSAGKTVFRVRMGKFQSIEEAKKAAAELKAKAAIGEYFIATQ